MGLIKQTTIDDIIHRTDIVQFVGEHVALQKRGIHFWGLCPFHNEKSPSFTVNPERNSYKCFGCGEGGSIFQFAQKQFGWDFREAVFELASRAGLQVEEENSNASPAQKREHSQQREQKRRLHDVMARAQSWFVKQLHSPDGKQALDYLLDERQLTIETIEEFGLGFAPDSFSALTQICNKADIKDVDIVACGLAKSSDKNPDRIYDRFRDRVMFPVFDVHGHVVAFSGRALNDAPEGQHVAKYFNSPETPIFRKGNQLFGLYKAKKSISLEGFALLVEGNVDQIAMAQAGFTNTVAGLGTAFTEGQAQLLAKFTSKVIVAFDGDAAGRKAALKTLETFMALEVDVRYVRFPDGDDPDTFINREGIPAIKKLIEHAPPLFDTYIEKLTDGPKSDLEKSQIIEMLQPYFLHITKPVHLDLFYRRLSQRLRVEESFVRSHLKPGRPKSQQSFQKPAQNFAPAPQGNSPNSHSADDGFSGMDDDFYEGQFDSDAMQDGDFSGADVPQGAVQQTGGRQPQNNLEIQLLALIAMYYNEILNDSKIPSQDFESLAASLSSDAYRQSFMAIKSFHEATPKDAGRLVLARIESGDIELDANTRQDLVAALTNDIDVNAENAPEVFMDLHKKIASQRDRIAAATLQRDLKERSQGDYNDVREMLAEKLAQSKIKAS